MQTPKPKASVVARTCPNPQALQIDAATPAARDWIIVEGKRFTPDPFWPLESELGHLPFETLLIVSACYDVEEVKEYLESFREA